MTEQLVIKKGELDCLSDGKKVQYSFSFTVLYLDRKASSCLLDALLKEQEELASTLRAVEMDKQQLQVLQKDKEEEITVLLTSFENDVGLIAHCCVYVRFNWK